MKENEAVPAEKSLKYMAWNIKEISENIKKIAELMERNLGSAPKNENGDYGVLTNKELNLPF